MSCVHWLPANHEEISPSTLPSCSQDYQRWCLPNPGHHMFSIYTPWTQRYLRKSSSTTLISTLLGDTIRQAQEYLDLQIVPNLSHLSDNHFFSCLDLQAKMCFVRWCWTQFPSKQATVWHKMSNSSKRGSMPPPVEVHCQTQHQTKWLSHFV